MAETSLRGNPVHTVGELPRVGTPAPSFKLAKTDLTDLTNDDLAGKRVVLNIFHSLDTGVCAASVRRFNELASSLSNTAVVCVSADLPFAQGRFCGAEGLENVISASTFRSDFGTAYGVQLADSKIAGLMARSVVVLDEHGTVVYSQLCPELSEEPNYEAAIAALA
ncbi:MAG: thiol peroxidase [Actinobacteria bacterium]|nr:thiol peroxidase [Actinomycetota bacterium]